MHRIEKAYLKLLKIHTHLSIKFCLPSHQNSLSNYNSKQLKVKGN